MDNNANIMSQPEFDPSIESIEHKKYKNQRDITYT